MSTGQKKRIAEGKIQKIEYETKPDKVTIQLKTKDQGVLNIVYQAHHSYFTQYGKKLHVGSSIKTLYYESLGGGAPCVGVTPVEIIEA